MFIQPLSVNFLQIIHKYYIQLSMHSENGDLVWKVCMLEYLAKLSLKLFVQENFNSVWAKLSSQNYWLDISHNFVRV